MAGVVTNGMMTGARLAGMNMEDPVNSSCPFSLGRFALGAVIRRKQFEFGEMNNLDTGAAVNTFRLNFGPDGEGDGRFCRTTSCECILDGGAWFQGYDENGVGRSLNGRLMGGTKVLCCAGERVKDIKIPFWDLMVVT